VGGGFRERERAVDHHAHLAARDQLEQIGDHRVDAWVLGQQRTAKEDAAQRVVVRPQVLASMFEPARLATPTLTSVPR